MTSSEEVCEVVITAPNASWLADFTDSLVRDRLAACGHNIATIRSIYRWRGVIHDEHEARVTLHTRRALIPAINKRLDAQHPYEVPCLIALPIVGGSAAYIQWIIEETASPESLRL